MNELREEIELPILQLPTETIWDSLQRHHAQLKSSLAANREQKAEIERLTALLKASEDWREAYQKGKYELYAMGGDVLEAAANHLPCNEGPLERQTRKEVGRPEIRSEVMRAEKAEAELASLRASVGEKWIETKELLQAFTESERNHLKYCRDNVYYSGLGPQDDRCDLCKKADLLLAPPTLPTEKE